MIEGHADDGRCHGIRHVRGVEARTEADLEDGDVHALAAEVRERGGGQGLEESRMGTDRAATDESLRGGTHGAHGPLEVVIGDVATIHCDALVHPDQMRRGVPAGSQSGGAKDRVDVGHDRALPVRARHEERRKGPFEVAHLFHERPDRVQAELHPEARALREVQPGETTGMRRAHLSRRIVAPGARTLRL